MITSELIADALLGERMGEIVGICRERFLKPGGRMIPRQVRLQVAPVDDVKADDRVRLPNPSRYGIDFSVVERRSVNMPVSARIFAGSLLAAPRTGYAYEAQAPRNTADTFTARLLFDVQQPGLLRGFGLWFSAALGEGVELTNAPPGTHSWDNLILPLERCVPVERGMAIELLLRGRSDSKMPFVLAWDTIVRRRDLVLQTAHQSTFFARMFPQGRVEPATGRESLFELI